MAGFFDKLSVLFRSRVNDFLDEVASPRTDSARSRQHTVESLRERINQAVAYEENLNKQINALEAEIMALNDQADRAVQGGRDALARHLIAKVQRREQHLTMLRADLETHQRIAQELIIEVNQLDAMVATADQMASDSERGGAVNIPVTTGADDTDDAAETHQAERERAEQAVNRFQKTLDQAGARINTLGDKLKSQRTTALDNHEAYQVDSPGVDDELEARRNRLMKK